MTEREKQPAHVAGLMLAAGQSRRFGADKRQALLGDGQTLLAASVGAASSVFSRLWLVLRASDTLQVAGVEVVVSQASASGMGHSLADGMDVISRQSDADAVAILLGDMPWIQQATVRQLVAYASAECIVVPTCNGMAGHPVIFGRRFWPALLELSGDAGARSVIQANADAVVRVAVGDAGVLRDVDTPDDVA